MKQRKNNRLKSGFTLIEIAASVIVIGLLLTAAVQLQSYVIAASSYARNRVVRSVGLWNAYMYAQRQPWYQQNEEQQDNFHSDDDMRYNYTQKTIDEQSELASYAQSNVVEYITGIRDDESQVTLVSYRYQPSQQEATE